jgi:hypothetical protein
MENENVGTCHSLFLAVKATFGGDIHASCKNDGRIMSSLLGLPRRFVAQGEAHKSVPGVGRSFDADSSGGVKQFVERETIQCSSHSFGGKGWLALDLQSSHSEDYSYC